MSRRHEAYDENCSLEGVRKGSSQNVRDLEDATGKSLAVLRMPGSAERSSVREGPQVRLQLCTKYEKQLED